MTILEKIKFEGNWLSEVDLTKENIKIAFAGIRATALEQQPCEDCISRQAVKEMLTETWTKYMPMELDVNLSFVLDKISALPSVTPKTGWIPVSEPPKEDGKYLVSRKNEGNICVEEAYYSTTSRTTFPKGFSIIKDNFSWRIKNVIAWMPLPSSYQGE